MFRNRLMASVVCGVLAAGFGCAANGEKCEKCENYKEHGKDMKMPVEQLPAPVVDGVKKAMPDGKIIDAEKDMKDGATMYELGVQSGGKTYEVKVGEDGKVVSQKIDEEDNDKDGKDMDDHKDKEGDKD